MRAERGSLPESTSMALWRRAAIFKVPKIAIFASRTAVSSRIMRSSRRGTRHLNPHGRPELSHDALLDPTSKAGAHAPGRGLLFPVRGLDGAVRGRAPTRSAAGSERRPPRARGREVAGGVRGPRRPFFMARRGPRALGIGLRTGKSRSRNVPATILGAICTVFRRSFAGTRGRQGRQNILKGRVRTRRTRGERAICKMHNGGGSGKSCR